MNDWPIWTGIALLLALVIAAAAHDARIHRGMHCVREHTEFGFIPMSDGKNVTMIPTAYSICDQWEKDHE